MTSHVKSALIAKLVCIVLALGLPGMISSPIGITTAYAANGPRLVLVAINGESQRSKYCRRDLAEEFFIVKVHNAGGARSKRATVTVLFEARDGRLQSFGASVAPIRPQRTKTVRFAIPRFVGRSFNVYISGITKSRVKTFCQDLHVS